MTTPNTSHTRPALDQLPAYAPGRTVPGAVKLASNEIPFPLLPSVNAAIVTAASSITRYPDNAAQALTELLAQRYDLPADQITVGCGSVALCEQLVQATCTAESEVVFGWRSFEAYPIITAVVGARAVKVPNTADHALDLTAMAAAITPATRLIFVCNPNNPTGTALTETDLDAFLDQVPADVLVVLDEAYREFVDDEAIPDGIEYARNRPNVVVLRTLSKAYGLAGLRVGYAISTPAVAVALRKVAVPFAVNSIAQAAAIAALTAEAELMQQCAYLVAERTRVRKALLAAGFQVPVSQANFVWLPIGEAAASFSQHCEDNGVIVRAFGEAQTGGVRVTIGLESENDLFLKAARSWPGPVPRE